MLACSILTVTAGNGADKKNGTTPPPMFVLGTNQGYLQMVYWTDLEEPQKNEDNEEFFEEMHQEWELQDLFRRNAEQYTKLFVDGVNTIDVKYVDEVLLNPDGEKIFFGELHGRPEIPSAGARYALPGVPQQTDMDIPGILLVTDSYLATHKPLTFESGEDDTRTPLPDNVVKKMEKKYGMKAERSQQSYTIGDRYTYGIIQFQGEYKKSKKKKYDPNEKSALALEIITDGNKVYSYPVEGWYDPTEGPTWNAEDGGEYFASDIVAAFQGPKGVEFYYVHWAPESATIGRFIINGGKLDRQQYTVYHSLIDESLPVWKTDIAEMRRLYVDEDPGENENVKLTKWTPVYIDYEGEQIWISNEDETDGAIFNRLDGELILIATVRANLKPSFPEIRDDNHYLVISGPAGGPSYYTEIYKMKNGRVAEAFNCLEVYGEIEGCALNGEEISAEQGKAYMNAVPEEREPFLFWTEINDE